jgi:hypothetical protein
MIVAPQLYREIRSETEAKPVGTGDDRAAQGDKEDQQDESAATARAGKSTPKTKAVLQPVEEKIQESQFE